MFYVGVDMIAGAIELARFIDTPHIGHANIASNNSIQFE